MSDLAELMARDPFKCTRDDIAKIVAFYREKHSQFRGGNLKAGATKQVSAKTAELIKTVGATNDLDL